MVQQAHLHLVRDQGFCQKGLEIFHLEPVLVGNAEAANLARKAEFLEGFSDFAIATELRQAPALHSDETSWWVAGPGWWLWVFTTQLLTFYVVAQSRGRELLSDILGKDFGRGPGQRLSGYLRRRHCAPTQMLRPSS